MSAYGLLEARRPLCERDGKYAGQGKGVGGARRRWDRGTRGGRACSLLGGVALTTAGGEVAGAGLELGTGVRDAPARLQARDATCAAPAKGKA